MQDCAGDRGSAVGDRGVMHGHFDVSFRQGSSDRTSRQACADDRNGMRRGRRRYRVAGDHADDSVSLVTMLIDAGHLESGRRKRAPDDAGGRESRHRRPRTGESRDGGTGLL